MKIILKFLRLFIIFKHKIHNLIDPVSYARSIGVKIGKNCRLIEVSFGSEPYLITIGNHVSATRTSFITHDGGVWIYRNVNPDQDIIAPINIGNNVFLGVGSIILPGVTIGNNVVVGAGSVVTKDFPSNCIIAGVPAKVLKSTDEYWKSAQVRLLPTKTMTSKEKKIFLINFFS